MPELSQKERQQFVENFTNAILQNKIHPEICGLDDPFVIAIELQKKFIDMQYDIACDLADEISKIVKEKLNGNK